MDTTLQEIYEWASNMKMIWNERGPDIEQVVAYDELERFVDDLQNLLNECERRRSDPVEHINNLYELSNGIFEKWISFEERQQSGSIIALNPVPIGGHKLPPLPYAYNALEPYISEEIMRLHHDKHHQSYVDGLNKAEKEMKNARKTNNYDLIKHWEREAAFNGAGHYLHTIFWDIMSPRGGGEPSGELLSQINHDFGSFKKMKDHFSAAAKDVEGGGWALLVWSPRSHRLEILQAEKHQNLSQQDMIPLLVLDVWEHAYYLQYKNERKPYIDNWWHIVNWSAVEKRFLQASQLRWQPF